MKNIDFLLIITIILCSLLMGNCLYEDQVGKFDWHQSYIGELKFAHVDSAGKRIIVATESNVLAALNLKTGSVLWRQVLEKEPHSAIAFLAPLSSGEAVIVSDTVKPLVRAFDTNTGALAWEWVIPSALPLERVLWAVSTEKIYAVVLNEGEDYEVLQFNVRTGALSGKWKNVAPWALKSKCSLSRDLLICYSNNMIHSIKFSLKDAKPLILDVAQNITGLQPVKSSDKAGVIVYSGNPGSGLTSQAVLFSDQGQAIVQCKALSDHAQWLLYDSTHEVNLVVQLLLKDEELHVITSDCNSGKRIEEYSSASSWPSSLGSPRVENVFCGPNRDDFSQCRLLVGTPDKAIVFIHFSGKVLWTREEALASVVAVEMLDLPVSEKDAAIEKEFDSKEAGLLGMFGRRLVSQTLQLQQFVQAVFGLHEPSRPSGQRADLVRDDFGLHKMIVVVTDAGKLFGLDNLNGEIVWQKRLTAVDTSSLQLFVQRTTRHGPFPAQCALLLKDDVTKESVLYTFNPITGQGFRKNLGYRAVQVMPLPSVDDESLRPLLLLDSSEKVYVEPQTAFSLALSLAPSTYLYVANRDTGVMTGYSLAASTSERLHASRVWEVVFQTDSQTLVNVFGKNPQERVHSQGRVLGDRSVLYKYVNPNLVAVVTKGTDTVHKYVLNVYLLDAVSGSIVFSISHKRAREPIHLVHTENWVVYTYFSEKWRRTEVAAIELYEGKTQSSSGTFSSLVAPVQPLVERQSYILPAMVQSMKPTVTEKGITSRHILVGLANGAVLEVPWVFVDPRRPVTVTAEMREEVVIPYMPELPLPSESIINYNKSLPRISGIHTSPSGLESTSLVLVYGLDLFYTRVAPSKTFDLLKEDFDPFLISMVLIALGLASYTTKRLASRKALKQAWK